MPGPWSLLVLVIAVGAGLVTVTFASLLVRSRQTALFKYLLTQLLLFNLLILAGLCVQYLRASAQNGAVALHPAIALVLIASMAPLKLGWLYAFAAMTLVLPGQEVPARFPHLYVAAASVFLGVWLVLLAVGPFTGAAGATLGPLLGMMELVVIGGAITACVHLLVRARSVADGPRRRSVLVLGGSYLGIFAIMIGSLAVGWLRPSGQTGGQLLGNGIVMILYNLLPLVWVMRSQPTGPITAASAMARYGISPREREIIELICAGFTNQEIADRLFISPATVKDHAYNVFRKTGVRNRVELANLMREDRVDGDGARSRRGGRGTRHVPPQSPPAS